MTPTPSDVEILVESDDEFEDSYSDPGLLRAEDVSGTVIYPLDWTVGTIVDQIDADPNDPSSTGILVTDPPFQRRTAWNDARQSLFIESLILGLPIPPLVLAESIIHPGQFYVLDGKQRLTAIRRFLLDEESLRLTGLELLDNELRGLNYMDIKSSSTLRKFGQSLYSQPVRTIVVRNWRTPALLHLIFARLNKAAVPLASHELRQSLYPGKFTNFINSESTRKSGVARARRLSEPDFRLRDAETLLRYIGIRTNLENYQGDLRQFLDRVLKGGNDHYNDIDKQLTSLVEDLDVAVSATFDIFGDAAFLRYDGDKEKYMPRFNMAVFDTMTWYFSFPEVAKRAVEEKAKVKRAFESLCRDNSRFSSYLTSTTKTKEAVDGRINIWGAELSSAIGMNIDPSGGQLSFLPIASKRSNQR